MSGSQNLFRHWRLYSNYATQKGTIILTTYHMVLLAASMSQPKQPCDCCAQHRQAVAELPDARVENQSTQDAELKGSLASTSK